MRGIEEPLHCPQGGAHPWKACAASGKMGHIEDIT
jgi:hypothetical protein